VKSFRKKNVDLWENNKRKMELNVRLYSTTKERKEARRKYVVSNTNASNEK